MTHTSEIKDPAARGQRLGLLIEAAQNVIDDYDEHRGGSERISMELLRATIDLVKNT